MEALLRTTGLVFMEVLYVPVFATISGGWNFASSPCCWGGLLFKTINQRPKPSWREGPSEKHHPISIRNHQFYGRYRIRTAPVTAGFPSSQYGDFILRRSRFMELLRFDLARETLPDRQIGDQICANKFPSRSLSILTRQLSVRSAAAAHSRGSNRHKIYAGGKK